MNFQRLPIQILLLIIALLFMQCDTTNEQAGKQLEEGFKNPPVSAKAGAYWYFMDGNLSKEGIWACVEAYIYTPLHASKK